MQQLPEPIPIHALFAADGSGPNREASFQPHELLGNADVIFASDVMTGQAFLVFGRELLEKIAAGGNEPVVGIVNIALDREPGGDELEQLLRLVEKLKGRHDYRPAEGS